jgi:hypothetical protein
VSTGVQIFRPRVADALGARLLPIAFVVGICGSTLAMRAGAYSAAAIGASFDRVAHGEVWRLVTSSLAADVPIVASLVSFVVIAGVGVVFCRGRLFWLAAAAGHVGSAATVYGFIAVSRGLSPGAFEPSVDRLDFGVSTMQAGWVGALACTAWERTRGSAGGRLLVVVGVAVLAVIGWVLHPDPSVLTFEHPVAFALGIVVAVVNGPRRAGASHRTQRPTSARDGTAGR